MPVDWYNGGMEHVTLHLLYSRFWAKFLYDIDIISCKEPYKKRTAHGMILGENGEKTVQVELGYKESSGIRSSTITKPFFVQRAES